MGFLKKLFGGKQEEAEAGFSYSAALSLRVPKLSVEEFKQRVRPQLVPTGSAEKAGVLTFPFTDTISTSLVLRMESNMPFLRAEDLPGLDAKSLLDLAISNLDADKAEMEVTATQGADKFIGMETHDGYDAARILLPRIRKFAAEKLGTSYYAGIPNCNFLILWSRECSARFKDYAIEKIETDYDIQEFPLSKKQYEVTETTITVVTGDAPR